MVKFTSESRKVLTLIILCLAQFMVLLDFSILNVALPSIQEDLSFSEQNLQWTISTYALTFGGFLLIGGRASDLLGRRRVFITGLGLLILASLVGGLAESRWILITARAFQGISAAIISPSALSLLTTTYKEGAERNRALSVWGAMAGGGFVAGTLLGGILTTWLSWRWVMFANIPIGVIALVLAPIILKESRELFVFSQIDFVGAITVTTGLIVLVYGLVTMSDTGWRCWKTGVVFSIAIAVLALFVLVESRCRTPLVPLWIFRRRTLMGASIVCFLIDAAANSTIFIITLYMQQILGFSAFQSSLALLPHAFAAMLAAPLSAWFTKHIGVKFTLVSGLITFTLGLLLLTRLPIDGSFVRDMLVGTLFAGLGISSSLVMATIAATSGIRNSEQGLVLGLLNSAQQIGGALGLATVVAASSAHSKAILATSSNSLTVIPRAITEGFQFGLTINVSLITVGIIVALFVIGGNRSGGVPWNRPTA